MGEDKKTGRGEEAQMEGKSQARADVRTIQLFGSCRRHRAAHHTRLGISRPFSKSSSTNGELVFMHIMLIDVLIESISSPPKPSGIFQKTCLCHYQRVSRLLPLTLNFSAAGKLKSALLPATLVNWA